MFGMRVHDEKQNKPTGHITNYLWRRKCGLAVEHMELVTTMYEEFREGGGWGEMGEYTELPVESDEELCRRILGKVGMSKRSNKDGGLTNLQKHYSNKRKLGPRERAKMIETGCQLNAWIIQPDLCCNLGKDGCKNMVYKINGDPDKNGKDAN